jgi:hypothetical protein
VARTFTNDGSLNCTFKVTAQGFTAWGFGTFAVVVRFATIPAATGRSLGVIGTDAQDFVEFFTHYSVTGSVAMYNGSSDTGTASTVTTSKWYVIVITKATGTVNPRGHMFDFGAGTWVHENMGGTLADASGTGATQHGVFGDSAGSESGAFDGQFLAQAAWKSRAMTDSEVERLPRGLWDIWSPDMLIEFPSGRDNVTRTTIDCSRNRMRQAVSGSQVTRGNIIGPPGFRLSALNRRR